MQVDIPTSSDCLQSLIEASLGIPEFEWEVGWSLASYNNDSQRSRDVFQTQVSLFLKRFPFTCCDELLYLKSLYLYAKRCDMYVTICIIFA